MLENEVPLKLKKKRETFFSDTFISEIELSTAFLSRLARTHFSWNSYMALLISVSVHLCHESWSQSGLAKDFVKKQFETHRYKDTQKEKARSRVAPQLKNTFRQSSTEVFSLLFFAVTNHTSWTLFGHILHSG